MESYSQAKTPLTVSCNYTKLSPTNLNSADNGIPCQKENGFADVLANKRQTNGMHVVKILIDPENPVPQIYTSQQVRSNHNSKVNIGEDAKSTSLHQVYNITNNDPTNSNKYINDDCCFYSVPSGQSSPTDNLDSGTCSDIDASTPPPLPGKQKILIRPTNVPIHERSGSLNSSGIGISSDEDDNSCDSINSSEFGSSSNGDTDHNVPIISSAILKCGTKNTVLTANSARNLENNVTDKIFGKSKIKLQEGVEQYENQISIIKPNTVLSKINLLNQQFVNSNANDTRNSKHNKNNDNNIKNNNNNNNNNNNIKNNNNNNNSSSNNIIINSNNCENINKISEKRRINFEENKFSNNKINNDKIMDDKKITGINKPSDCAIFKNRRIQMRKNCGLLNGINKIVEENSVLYNGVIRDKSSLAEESSDIDFKNADKYLKFHLNENNFEDINHDASEKSKNLDDTFAGCKDFNEPEENGFPATIRSSRGTIRGVKNRVRAGIATFLQIKSTKTWQEKEVGKVVVYTTTMGIVRETYQRCLKVRQILKTHLVKFDEKDVFMSREVQTELRERMDSQDVTVPQIFVEGIHIGDAETIDRLNESGELRRILKPYKSPDACNTCEVCGGYRLLPCGVCNGSKKSVHRNHFTAEMIALKCMNCDEVGLVKCYAC